MSVKQADLARAWGLSRGRISQMVKSGMPLSSLEEAAAWRVAHHGGASVPGRQGGQDKSDSVINGGGDLPPKPKPPKPEDLKRKDLVGVAARLQESEVKAWEKWNEEFDAGNHNAALVAARHYESMVKPLVSTVEKINAIRLQERETVLLSEIDSIYGRHLQALRMAIKNLPARLSARCNPSDPGLAKQVLHEAVERIFKTMNEFKA